MKIVGKININNITEKDIEKYKIKTPIYDFKSCSCQFGYKCDEDIPKRVRIVGYK